MSTKKGISTRLVDFIHEHPHGWGHAEWEGLLDGLRDEGYDTQDPEAIGRALEKERVRHHLDAIPGVGPKRQEALMERFPTLWALQHASVEELADIRSIPRALAQKVHAALR